jgi:uncharacterized protein YbjT (DUF2867 family)
MNEMYSNVFKWKLKSENHLRESGLKYIILRPGKLKGNKELDSEILF